MGGVGHSYMRDSNDPRDALIILRLHWLEFLGINCLHGSWASCWDRLLTNVAAAPLRPSHAAAGNAAHSVSPFSMEAPSPLT